MTGSNAGDGAGPRSVVSGGGQPSRPAGSASVAGGARQVSGDAESSEREFAVLLDRLGISMPPEWAGGVLAGYRGLRGLMELVRDA